MPTLFLTVSILFSTSFANVLHFEALNGNEVNNSPVIGVLTQGIQQRKQYYGDEVIDVSIAKYLELAGGKVVPIKGKQPIQYYKDLFGKINGVFFPGGGANVTSSPYATSARIMYDLAKTANQKGDYFPIWGTCLGFEVLTFLTAEKDVLDITESAGFSLPLKLRPDYSGSRLLKGIDPKLVEILKNEKIAANAHHYSLLTKTYESNEKLKDFYRIISTNKDKKGIEFVSTFEAHNYPFYGTQWHPEMNIYFWGDDINVTRTPHSRWVTQYMANFFIDEARKNLHKFTSTQEMAETIVENDFRVYNPSTFDDFFYYNISDTV